MRGNDKTIVPDCGYLVEPPEGFKPSGGFIDIPVDRWELDTNYCYGNQPLIEYLVNAVGDSTLDGTLATSVD